MHRILLLLAALILPLPAAAQNATPAPDTPPPTILISIDGYRADYLDRGLTPAIAGLAAKGAKGALRPSFPTKTFPNHYTVVTGLRPDRNGIVGNSMIDPRRPGQVFSLGDARQSLDRFWWDEAEPLWITAEKAGVRTATMFWPGSEVPIHDKRPQDWLRYDMAVTDGQRVQTVLDWMRRPAAIRPRFVTLYFDAVDMAGHRFGPDSKEVNDELAKVDAHIGTLVAGLAEMGVEANIVLVADHGMAATDESRVIQLDGLIDSASYTLVEGGPYAAIEPAAATDNRVFDAFLKPHEHMQCYRKEDLPKRLHYGKNPRVAAIVCLADDGWTILSGTPKYPVKGGAHGYDNAFKDMLAIFVAAGPGIKPTADTGIADNVEVYPLLAALIDVPMLENDATGALADKLAKGRYCLPKYRDCRRVAR